MVNGNGAKIGPVLNGLAQRRSRSWVQEHFADPDKLSPGSTMPPYSLSQKDMDNLTSYLFSLPDAGGNQ
jgi:ubiquinol-cytochrome c reductase cytochrome b subunit